MVPCKKALYAKHCVVICVVVVQNTALCEGVGHGKEEKVGLLGRIFGGGESFPPLQNDSPMIGQLRKDIKGLEKLAVQVPDRIEIVPGRHGTYVFIGKQPKNFDLAW